MIWFTADQHFWHRNIIKYTDRPFDNIRSMNNQIIQNYQDVINEDDTVFFLGDLMLGGKIHKNDLEGVIDQLPGTKHLICGNHDRLSVNDYTDIGFTSVHSTYQNTFMNNQILLNHDPAGLATIFDGWVISAHVHNNWKTRVYDDTIFVNVGIDVWDYKPVSIADVYETFQTA